MKLFLIGILIILLTTEFVHSFTPNEFCFISEKTCTGKYDSKNRYKIECKREKCSGQLGFQCDDDYCAKSEAACDKLLDINYLFKIYLKSTVTNFKFQKDYRNFFQNVKNCTQKPYEWNRDDVCQNGKNCYYAHLSSMRLFGKVKLFIPIECPCPKLFTYRCGNNYCASHKRACDELTLNLDEIISFNANSTIGSNSNTTSFSIIGSELNIKDCGNSNLRI